MNSLRSWIGEEIRSFNSSIGTPFSPSNSPTAGKPPTFRSPAAPPSSASLGLLGLISPVRRRGAAEANAPLALRSSGIYASFDGSLLAAPAQQKQEAEEKEFGPSALDEYAKLAALFERWLKGKHREEPENEGGWADGAVLYTHPKLLPLLVHTLRYSCACWRGVRRRGSSDRLLAFLLELKIFIAEDLGNAPEENAGMRGHSLVGLQALLKELILLQSRFADDESGFPRFPSRVVLVPMVQEVIALLLLADLRYKSFLSSLLYCAAFAYFHLPVEACVRFLSALVSSVIGRFVALEQPPGDVALINLSALVAFVNETLNQEAATSQLLRQFVAERVRQQADSAELAVSAESQFNQQLKRLSQLSFRQLRPGSGEIPAGTEAMLSYPKMLLADSLQGVDVVETMVPLVELLTKLPLIVVQNSHIYELLCVVLSRQLYCECYGCEAAGEAELSRRITRLTTLQRTMDHLITACHEDGAQTQLLVCVYWVVLHDCYCAVNGQTDNGEIILHLLQSECLQLADQLAFASPNRHALVGSAALG